MCPGNEHCREGELVLNRVARTHRPCHLAVEPPRRMLCAGFNDRGLVAEVLVHRAARDVGCPCDIDDGGLVQTLPAEAPEGGLDYEPRRRLGSTTRRSCRVS